MLFMGLEIQISLSWNLVMIYNTLKESSNVKKYTVFLCTGEGGHKTEIEKLLNIFRESEVLDKAVFIGILEGQCSGISGIKNHFLFALRRKNNVFISCLLFPGIFLYDVLKAIFLIIRYNPVALISTGPGSVLILAIIFKILKLKIIFIEDRARISTKSITGTFMYKLSDKFYVQNSELLNIYPDAIYSGLL
jgi:UDP-N-acetylglucosamine:LPS N-acetylglucosamine transferase